MLAAGLDLRQKMQANGCMPLSLSLSAGETCEKDGKKLIERDSILEQSV